MKTDIDKEMKIHRNKQYNLWKKTLMFDLHKIQNWKILKDKQRQNKWYRYKNARLKNEMKKLQQKTNVNDEKEIKKTTEQIIFIK